MHRKPIGLGRQSVLLLLAAGLAGHLQAQTSAATTVPTPGFASRQVLVAPTGAVLQPDVANWAWHEYGMRVGFWRLYDALREPKRRWVFADVGHNRWPVDPQAVWWGEVLEWLEER